MFEDVRGGDDIEYKYVANDYSTLINKINQPDVAKKKLAIAKVAKKMACDLCKMDYFTVGLCGFFAGVKGLLTNPDFIYACVSQDCKKARKDFKQKLYQEMFNNVDIMMIAAPNIINPKNKELLQDISMLNSFYALCVNTVQMMYKYYTNENFRLDDDELEKSYNQLCGNEQSMMDAIHKNIRAIVYLANGGNLPISSHPNDISKLASYFLNNVLPQGQQFLSISQISEGHKTNAANRNLDLNMIGVHAYVSIEMFNCLADDALKIDGLNGLVNLFAYQEIPFIQNWLQKRKETVKKNLNLQHDIATYTTAQLLQTIQQKATQTAEQQKEPLICQQALQQIASCLQYNLNIFPWNAQSPCGHTYNVLGLRQWLQLFCQCPTLQNYICLLFATNATPIYYNPNMDAIGIMQTFANIKYLNSQFIQDINTAYGQNIDKNFSNYLIANFLSTPFEKKYRDNLCQKLDSERQEHDKSINNILNWSKDQQSKIQMKTQYILQNYPGLKAISSPGHYYNTYYDIYACGNTFVPIKQYNSLKSWGPAQNDKQLSFDIITATPKDIDRQTNNQQLPDLKKFVRHDQKDSAGKTDCLLNLMGFNNNDIYENHCGIQNIHTLSSTYNYSNGNSRKPPKIGDTIFDSMLHGTNRCRPEQQIQTAQDIWLTGLDKPLWAKSINAEPITRFGLCAGTTQQDKSKICNYLQQLIQSWYTAVCSPNDQNINTLRIKYRDAYQTIQKIDVYSKGVKTNTNLAENMNTIARLHFQTQCWQAPCDNDLLLLHIKEVVIPILCAVSGQQKYDVFFGCYNDYPTFQKMIEQKFHKLLSQNNSQNNQLPDTNNQNNNINNINNNTNVINNNTNGQRQSFNSDTQSNIKLNVSGDLQPNITKNDNTFQHCMPQCCVNLCAKICPNYIQQSTSLDD